MGKQCRTCVFNTKKNECNILKERIKNNCWAWADEKEYERRKKDIRNYKERFDLKGKIAATKQKLDAGFMELYEQNFTDIKIAQALDLTPNTVGNYRKKLGLESNYKKSLRQQANKK